MKLLDSNDGNITLDMLIQARQNKNKSTNADIIRSMTDEELATYLIQLTEVIRTCDICEPSYRENGDCDCQCESGVLRWLKAETE